MEINMKIHGVENHVMEIDGCGSDELTFRIDDGPWFTLDKDDCEPLVKFIASFGGHA